MPHADDSLFGYAWLLVEAVAAFSTDSLPYCLIGAVALGTYGRPRATQDLDLLILGDRMGCDAYRTALLGKGFEVSSKWRDANPMARDVVMRLHHPSAQDFPLDLVFATSQLHPSTLNRRQPELLAGKEVWVSSPEDLLLLKRTASRPAILRTP